MNRKKSILKILSILFLVFGLVLITAVWYLESETKLVKNSWEIVKITIDSIDRTTDYSNHFSISENNYVLLPYRKGNIRDTSKNILKWMIKDSSGQYTLPQEYNNYVKKDTGEERSRWEHKRKSLFEGQVLIENSGVKVFNGLYDIKYIRKAPPQIVLLKSDNVQLYLEQMKKFSDGVQTMPLDFDR